MLTNMENAWLKINVHNNLIHVEIIYDFTVIACLCKLQPHSALWNKLPIIEQWAHKENEMICT